MTRIFITVLLLLCGVANAANTISRGTWAAFRGTTQVAAGLASEQACVDAIASRTDAAQTAYTCRETITAVAVPPPPPPPTPPVVSFGASPATVVSGSMSTLSWSATNATGCIASGGWSGARGISGSESTGPLSVGTAYTLTCNGPAGTGSASTTVNIGAASGQQFGLEWPGTGTVRRMLVWSAPMPRYDATYIFKVYPKGPKNNGAGGNYWTTFFAGNNGPFSWGSNACSTFYGAHPYPFGGSGSTSGQNWEVSANCNDFSFVSPNGSAQVQWNRWFTQAFRAWKDVANNRYCHEFYFDLPDTNKVISFCGWSGDLSFAGNPPNPAIMMGQTANVNGLSWGGYPGWEEFKGIIRGIQFYNGLLSVADILSEVTLPQSTATGNAKAWFINTDPRPADVTDKKTGGTPHNPTWDGTTATEWTP